MCPGQVHTSCPKNCRSQVRESGVLGGSALMACLRVGDVFAQARLVPHQARPLHRIGPAKILRRRCYRTRTMSWGCDTALYRTAKAMRAELPARLAAGPRVIKRT